MSAGTIPPTKPTHPDLVSAYEIAAARESAMKKISVIGGMLDGEFHQDPGPGKFRMLTEHAFARAGSKYSVRTLQVGDREVRAFVVDGMSDETAVSYFRR
jgi:hypothetical protein